jgi:hypothetical protein
LRGGRDRGERYGDVARPLAKGLVGVDPAAVLLEARRFGQGKEDDFFAGHGADVMVHVQHLDARDLVDDRFQHRARQIQQVAPDLLDQIPAFLRRQRLSQLPFGHGQNAQQADDQQILDDVDANLLAPAIPGNPLGSE